jgi:hypothetical protein
MLSVVMFSVVMLCVVLPSEKNVLVSLNGRTHFQKTIALSIKGLARKAQTKCVFNGTARFQMIICHRGRH